MADVERAAEAFVGIMYVNLVIFVGYAKRRSNGREVVQNGETMYFAVTNTCTTVGIISFVVSFGVITGLIINEDFRVRNF